MANTIMAGVGDIMLLDKNGNIIVTSKTLTDSGISVGITAEEIRGGLSAALIGRYFHSSQFSLTLTDATFNMQYLALNVGGQVVVGGNGLINEGITVAATNKIVASNTPVDFAGLGTIGWMRRAGSDDWSLITFVGNEATVSGLQVGDKVCIKYYTYIDNMDSFVVPADMIPNECYAILTAPLFAADNKNYSTSSKVADLVNMLCL